MTNRPKTRRRKPIDCAICGEDTLDAGGVCADCRQAARVGKATLKVKTQNDEPKVVQVSSFNLTHNNAFKDQKRRWRWSHDIETNIKEVLLELAGAEIVKGGHVYSNALSYAVGDVFYDETRKRLARDNSANYGYIMRPSQAKRLQKLVELIRSFAKAEYDDGRSSSAYFLQRAARGEISLEKIDEYYVELAKATQAQEKK